MKSVNTLEEDILERLRNPSVTRLVISYRNLGPDGATALAEALKGNTTLDILALAYSKLGPDGATALVEVLKHNTTLRILDLTSNNLGPDGATALAEVLKHNTTLRILDLTSNNLGPDGTTALVEALKGNATLTTLNLDYNPLCSRDHIALTKALKRNMALATALSKVKNLLAPLHLPAENAASLSDALQQAKDIYNDLPRDSNAAKNLRQQLKALTALTDVKNLLEPLRLPAENAASLSNALQRAEDIYSNLPRDSNAAKNLRQQLDELIALSYLRTHRLLEACLAFSKLTTSSPAFRYHLALELLGQENDLFISQQQKGQLCFMLLRDCPKALNEQYQTLCLFRNLPFSSAPATLAEILSGHSYETCALEPEPHSVVTEDTFQGKQQNLFQTLICNIALQRISELQSKTLDEAQLTDFITQCRQLLSTALPNDLPTLCALILASETLLEDPRAETLEQYRANWTRPSTHPGNLFPTVSPAQALAASLAEALESAPKHAFEPTVK
jgi:hypothetical protein